MKRSQGKFLIGVATLALACASARAENLEDLPPYKMIRSLQYVQDSVVLGDHSAMEMQRFMLATIDTRLRTAERDIFDDPRNVDAALVYAMSGGNPETLDYLADNDIDGNFDSRITESLRKYLTGKGALTAKTLGDTLPEYKNSKIGPYLALVSGNAIAKKDARAALKHYDWARLTAPGTIVEEAALRRSLYLATQSKDLVKEGMRYSSSYVRRFLHSPYASQFADLFVDLTVQNFDHIEEDDILQVLAFMDKPRQRTVYLRMARRAALAGMQRLAKLSSERALALSAETDAGPKALADLYAGLVDVPTADVASVMQAIVAIPADQLSVKDQALQRAAKAVAEEVLRKPAAESLTQASANTVVSNDQASPVENADVPDGAMTSAELDASMDPRAQPTQTKALPLEASAASTGEKDPEFDSFVSAGRSKLDEIDSLLKGDKK
ncbi:chemotaxis protein MotC [Pararhizobium sp.]|uniref:chemotaxis protein MotC n=1 Tax=Pararhizobium sp. TaxID=1977563 RepID=UPI0027207FB1|nr:chemotaxis protein MotC [Pararhizobium sp.]MDO9418246.1 chemotaxis protein MotC [Pararhizobium sp.]